MSDIISPSAVNNVLLEISSLQEMKRDHFIEKISRIVHSYIDIYFLHLFLKDPDGKSLIFRAGTEGEFTNRMLSQGYKFNVDSVYIDKIKMRDEYYSIFSLPTDSYNNLDIKLEEGPHPNYVSPLLPETRSQISLPLRFQGNLIGLLVIGSAQTKVFTLDSIIYFQLLADQIALKLHLLSE